jgi:hypothetical protein
MHMISNKLQDYLTMERRTIAMRYDYAEVTKHGDTVHDLTTIQNTHSKT